MAFLVDNGLSFSYFVNEVYMALNSVLSAHVSLFGYTFVWSDLLKYSMLTLFFGACMILLFGGEIREK